MNKTTLDLKKLMSNRTILDKNELSLKRETIPEVYVSSIFTHGHSFEERTTCCSYTHGVVTLLVKNRLEIFVEQSQ